MSSAYLINAMTFEQSATERLKTFLSVPSCPPEITQLTPDASTREFFRVVWNGQTAIACVYPEPIDDSLPQIDVTRLFLECGLPVARIFETAPDAGIIIHEDFGDVILRDLISEETQSEHHIDSAIALIARIQACTKNAYDTGSISSRLKFDREKLVWELEFFKQHYFVSLGRSALKPETHAPLSGEFSRLAEELEHHACVLTHRDFHAANLMVKDEQLRIIDHQDARIGSPLYDLVSLLLDRIEVLPSDEYIVRKKDLLQKARGDLGLGPIDEIDHQFDLVTVQRCLKAIGTFSNQAANFQKKTYLKYINPMFQAVSHACRRLGRFENIKAMVENEVVNSE